MKTFLSELIGKFPGKGTAAILKTDDPIADKVRNEWLSVVQSATPVVELESNAIRSQVRQMYEKHRWRVPPDSRVVIVPSPFAMVVVAGLASVYWASRKTIRHLPSRATDDSIMEMVRKYVPNQVGNAAQFMVYDPVDMYCHKLSCLLSSSVEVGVELVGDVLDSKGTVFDELSSRVIHQPAREAILEACRSCTDDGLLSYSPRDTVSDLGLQDVVGVIGRTMDAVNPGNLGCGIPAVVDYLTRKEVEAVQRLGSLSLVTELATIAGPWVIHPEFAAVCDRPELLRVNEEGRLHSADGPACRWRDGARIYGVRGVRVGSRFVDQPESTTAEDLEKMSPVERNACFDLAPKSAQVVCAIHEMEDKE